MDAMIISTKQNIIIMIKKLQETSEKERKGERNIKKEHRGVERTPNASEGGREWVVRLWTRQAGGGGSGREGRREE